jgi:hypothetical protein
MREQVKPMPADEEDPPTNYVTAREEMIARAPTKLMTNQMQSFKLTVGRFLMHSLWL